MYFDLAVDVGNTSIKIGVFYQHELILKHVVYSHTQLQSLFPFVLRKYIQRVVYSNVSNSHIDRFYQLLPHAQFFSIDQFSTYPFTIRYRCISLLGSDRLAAAVGAYSEFQTSCIVVDLGTALTCEVVHAHLGYLGGTISPGIQMRLQILHSNTSRLPLIHWNGSSFRSLGDDTESCMLAGCILGIVGEIDNFATRMQRDYPDEQFKLVLTGGDVYYVSKELQTTYHFRPDLVLCGLINLLDIQCFD